jgi:hypothetical protein
MRHPPRPYTPANIGYAWAEIKEWRTKEFEAGRPSGLDDFCRAHGLCPECCATGLARNANGMGNRAIGWDGEVQLLEVCEVCAGTGKLTNPENSTWL